jgi:hypothetical protein
MDQELSNRVAKVMFVGVLRWFFNVHYVRRLHCRCICGSGHYGKVIVKVPSSGCESPLTTCALAVLRKPELLA